MDLTYILSIDELKEWGSKTQPEFYSLDFMNKIKIIFMNLSSKYPSTSLLNFWCKLQDDCLSLECLWLLHSYNLIQFTSYLYYNPNALDSLREQFASHIWCQDENVREVCLESVSGLLAVLINLGAHSQRDICRPGQSLLAAVLDNFVSRLVQDHEIKEEPIPFVQHLILSSEVAQSKLRGFCVSTLQALLHSEPGAVSVEQAVQDQPSHFTVVKTSPAIIEVFTQILSNLSGEEVVSEFIRVVTSEGDFNWRWLLTAMSVFVTLPVHQDACELLKGTLEEWLNQALSTQNTALLAAALLGARQCCAHKPKRFTSYGTWFGSLQIRQASSFKFLFHFLSQLVPHEPVLCLKIHVNKIPSAPANCHSVVTDYTMLAKTRLADLNQTTDYLGLFGEYTTSEQEGREADVAKVVSHFKQTQEVMKIIHEASVFRRQFYEKVFLGELLKDHNPAHVDFIEKLNSIGKIPYGLYNRWRQLQ